MIYLSDLDSYLKTYLNFDQSLLVEKIDPIMTNGLMVKGKEKIEKIGFGVSASLTLFEKAKKAKCDCLIVHHAFNFPSYNHYECMFQNRIAFLINNKISLFGYHFLLDAHPDIGNNAQIIKTIGAKILKPFLHQDNPWGWVGEYEKNKEFEEIILRIKPYLSSNATVYSFGPKSVKYAVACSGKGAPNAAQMQELIEKKIDLYITGEVHEWNRELFREAKINFIAGGHYHTEVFGIKALMEKVKKQFTEVTVEWLDLENTV